MKKILSLILSICMLLGIMAGIDFSAYADWNYNGLAYADTVAFETTYQKSYSQSDYSANSDFRYHSYMVNIPIDGILTINISAECFNYLANSIYIMDSNNVTRSLYSFALARDYGFNGKYYNSKDFNLTKGIYYIMYSFGTWNEYYGSYEITFNYKPNISTPSSFKVSSRGTTSLKLAWSKVANVSGYQLQRKSGDSYKTITNTTATSATVKNLSVAVNYKFRVRAYKTVDGKKYYGSWKYLTTPTRPSKVSIKTPSTNSKHQIAAKWNKVTRASGYQVQFCKNSSCSNVIATRTVSGGSKVSYTGKGFTKGRNYYIRVRAYRTVDGTKYYGAWSNVKSIKCK